MLSFLETPLPLWLQLLVAAVMLFVFNLWRNHRSCAPPQKAARHAVYDPQSYLFTKSEWSFACVLRKAIRHDWLLMGKVRIADILAVRKRKTMKEGEWMRAFARISQKHIDYVLVDPASGRIVCCIELDDPSHERPERVKRDIFVNSAFQEAGVPLLRIPTAPHYDVKKLRRQIREAVRT